MYWFIQFCLLLTSIGEKKNKKQRIITKGFDSMSFSRFSSADATDKTCLPIFGIRQLPLYSLEKATEPLESQVLGLSEQIRWAKRNCHFPSPRHLTQDESAAIYLYTMESATESFYEVLNRILRSGKREAIKSTLHYLKLFVTAVEKLPAFNGNVWRAIRPDVTNLFSTGETFTWWAIKSCSFLVNRCSQFASENGTLFMIESRTGRNIATYSSVPSEDEVVFVPGTEFLVVGIARMPNGFHVIHLREILDSDSNDVHELSLASTVPGKNPVEQLQMKRIDLADGGYYEGYVDSENVYNGKGILVDSAGTRTEGRFRHGKLEGEGIITWQDGRRYEGTFQNGFFHGQGKMILPGGGMLVGNWQYNLFMDEHLYSD